MVAPTGSLPDGISIDANPGLDEVAQMFGAAFIGEWDWYFGEMGYCPQSPTAEQELHSFAKRFVSGADVYFIAKLGREPVAVSSLVLNMFSGRAEFHTGVGVTPTGRGRNLGKLLTDFTLDWARRKGMTSAEVRTQERLGVRNRNIEMYQSCGASRRRTFVMFGADLS